MSWFPCDRPEVRERQAAAAINTVLVPRTRDLGGFEVRRVLPSPRRQTIGPFIFLDQLGPTRFAADKGIDVRPHPHIGLATVTYLIQGEVVHRDSLGSVQTILPGDVNWMTAGRGIVHSERSSPDSRRQPQDIYGLQFWVALPARHEEMAPNFEHYEHARLPSLEGDGINARIVAGSSFGRTSPVATRSVLFLVDVRMVRGATLAIDTAHPERAAYLFEGRIEVDGETFDAAKLLAFAPDKPITVKAVTDTRLILLGGEPIDGPRHIWWNFVSSRRDRIEQAKADWKRNQFGLVVPGETEFIPLPEDL